MKNEIKFGIIVGLLLIIYVLFMAVDRLSKGFDQPPLITVPETVLQVSVRDQESALLNGIVCTDKEDGDLTSQVLVESLSEFNDQNERTVTYVVCDSHDNMAKATRKIQYTDYTKPSITLIKPMIYDYAHMIDVFLEYVKAESCIDGDISSKIMIRDEIKDDGWFLYFTATDSCGGSSTLMVKPTEIKSDPNVDIELSQYMITVPVGTEINPYSYVVSMNAMGMNYMRYLYEIEILNDYDPYTPGYYEFIYSLVRSNGDYGITKLAVIVE